MQIIQIVIVLFALFALSRAFLRFKDNALSIRDFLFWLVLWMGVITVAFMPQAVIRVSEFLGIGRGVDMVLYLGMVTLFYLIFRLYVRIENQEKEITGVVRKIAIERGNKKR
jgi:small membrane protein